MQAARGAVDAARGQLATSNAELTRTEGQCSILKVWAHNVSPHTQRMGTGLSIALDRRAGALPLGEFTHVGRHITGMHARAGMHALYPVLSAAAVVGTPGAPC